MTGKECGCVPEWTQGPVSALTGVARHGRHGHGNADAGVTASEITGSGLATIAARTGRREALRAAARSAFGCSLPDSPKQVLGRGIAFIWSGPDQWLAHAPAAPAGGMEALLREPFATLASIVDQSHARSLLRIGGPRVRDALAKGVPVDLHPCAFQPGDAAATIVAHVPVHLWQVDAGPTYILAVPRSLTQSFWHWLEASAAEYGLDFVS
jgi:methylglutamate dehydrogenase subunit D